MKYVIYKLKSPSGKVYIGQTGSFKNRMAAYRRGDCKKQRRLHAAILKYGWDNIEVEIIYRSHIDDFLDIMEINFIRYYNSAACGYNISLGGVGVGGSGMRGRKHSAETKAKMAKVHRDISDDTRKKISQAQMGKNNHFFGRKHSDETREKMAASKRNMSAETRAKMSAAKKNMSEETRKKISQAGKGKMLSSEYRLKLSLRLSGENSHSAKLSWAIVKEIRAEIGLNQTELAAKYFTSQQNISRILSHRSWKTIS